MTKSLDARFVRGAFDFQLQILEKALNDLKELADDIIKRLEADE